MNRQPLSKSIQFGALIALMALIPVLVQPVVAQDKKVEQPPAKQTNDPAKDPKNGEKAQDPKTKDAGAKPEATPQLKPTTRKLRPWEVRWRADRKTVKLRTELDVQTSLGERFMSLVGLAILIGFCLIMSKNRRHVPWRLVLMGVGLQILFGAIMLRTDAGAFAFQKINDVVSSLLNYSDKGSEFLFGDLLGYDFGRSTFAFKVLPTIIFFSSLMTVLYHIGIMQWLVKIIAVAMQKTMRTSGAETLSAAGNIFVGQTEAPLLIKPFVDDMTESELMAVMTGGFATVAGGVMAAYVGLLDPFFPGVAGHLLTASVMSAPAALVCAKIMIPEVDPKASKTYGSVQMNLEKPDVNIIDAAARGASEGLKLTLNVGAMLLAFIALVALADDLLGYSCHLAGLDSLLGFVGDERISMSFLLGKLLAPVAYIMGVPWEDAEKVGALLGKKTVLNEFVAYLDLAMQFAKDPNYLRPRSLIICSYALCGFANFASVAIQIGGISGIAPKRRSDLARLGLRAMVAGTLAAFMTGTVAGLLV
jgi:concentrative nucleoside transporter, CNT family